MLIIKSYYALGDLNSMATHQCIKGMQSEMFLLFVECNILLNYSYIYKG